jgi:hypothetical protein
MLIHPFIPSTRATSQRDPAKSAQTVPLPNGSKLPTVSIFAESSKKSSSAGRDFLPSQAHKSDSLLYQILVLTVFGKNRKQRGGGASGADRKERRGLWAKLPFFFLSIQNRNRGGDAQGRPAGGGRRPSRAWRRLGVGGMERGGRGRLVHVLTSGWGGLWREIDGGGRSVTGAACGGRRWELGGERGKCLGGAGRGAE